MDYAVEIEEFVEEIELMSNLFLKIESQNGVMTSDQYLKIFRILHNLKGTLGMCEMSDAAKFVHLLEDYFMTFQNSTLSTAVLNYFIQSSQLLIDCLIKQCPIDLDILLISQNRLNVMNNQIVQESSNLNLTEQSQIYKKLNSAVLLLSKCENCSIAELLNQNQQLEFVRIFCPDELYNKQIINKQLNKIIINMTDIDQPLSSLIWVLNKYVNEAEIIIIGDNQSINSAKILYSEIQFSWIGKDIKNFETILLKKIIDL